MSTSLHLFGFEIILYNNYGLYGNYGHSSHTSHKTRTYEEDTHMKNSAVLKRQMRYQQWGEEVKDFNSRTKDMTVWEWCALHDISAGF